jgi:hypothetical protein
VIVRDDPFFLSRFLPEIFLLRSWCCFDLTARDPRLDTVPWCLFFFLTLHRPPTLRESGNKKIFLFLHKEVPGKNVAA